MACYWPIPASQMGSEPPRLWPPLGSANLALPCGKCIGCRTDRATQWANRCQHEASAWRTNAFLTLTYDDDHLPPEGHLQPRDLQLFIKRLRKHAHSNGSGIDRDRSSSIRYFACGEYGDSTNRPHYHALLFNCGFNDREKVGKDLYSSPLLEQLWPYGQNRLGDCTPAAASYIAQYNLKKQGQGDHDADGVWRPAPFLRMSLKPAIGAKWADKYATDLGQGYLVQEGGRKTSIPRYYQKRVKELQPLFFEALQANAAKHRMKNPTDNNEPERKRDAEEIHKRRKELQERRKL